MRIFHFFDNLMSHWFLTKWFVWAGLALIAIPIIIHLLNRRRFKQVTWAAMEFLLRAMRKNRRRLKFEQWLLLATRCLLIALLGVALARPMGCENGVMAQFGRHSALNVFIIDNSYSTGYLANHGDAKTHLDQAKKVVQTLLNRARSGGESVVVITAARPADALVSEPQVDLEAARQVVDRIEQSYSSTDLHHAMELALDVARQNEKQANKNLYIFTDATRSAWEGSDAASLKQIGPELAAEYKITHINLAQGQTQWNGAIVDVSPVDNLVTTKFKQDLKADIRGYFPGVDPGHNATLQWKIDDQPIESAGGDIKLSAATKPITLSDVAFPTGGPHVLTLNLVDDSDRLSADNVRHRVIDVASELKVLIVEGKRDAGPLGGSGDFLGTALAGRRDVVPGKPQITDSSFAPEVITDLELGNKVLGDYSAVVLAGVGQISPGESDAMAKYVQQGGTLMFFMGDAVSKENYNALLLKRNHLLPGELVKVMSVGVNEKEYNFDFKPKSVLHPLMRAFANMENSGLDGVRIRSYWQVDVGRDSSAERVLNYVPLNAKTAADPAITVQNIGQGRVIFCSTSANLDWTDFANKMAYLEVVQELLGGSVRTGDWWMNRTVGERLIIPSSVRMTSTPVLSDSVGNTLVVSPPESESTGSADSTGTPGAASDPGGWRSAYHTAPLTKPGLYWLALGDRKTPIAVNVPAAEEADVTTITEETIRHDLGDVEMTMLGSDVPTDAVAGRDRNDFSWWTMMLVLALAGFECFIAMRFGHFRRTDVKTAGAAA